MPVAVSYPGVYVEEISSGVRTITGVATSITAFLGRAAKGPVNKAVTINSYGDFERQFGGLGVDYPMSYAVKDFYLNGGSQAIIVRLFHPDLTTAEEASVNAAALAVANAAVGADAGAAATAAKAKATDDYPDEPEKAAVKDVVDAAEDEANPTAASVKDAAAKAVKGAVKPELSEDQRILAAAAAQAVADATEGADAAAAADAAQAEADKYTQDPGKSAAEAVAKAANTEANPTADSVKVAALKAVANAAPNSRARLTIGGITLEASSQGTWGNKLEAKVKGSVPEEVCERYGLADGEMFNLLVQDTGTQTTETFLNVSLKPSARQIEKVLKNESNLVVAVNPPLGPVPAEGDWVKVSEKASDGGSLKDSDYLGSPQEKSGLYALEDADLFNLVCIPPDTRDGNTSKTVYQNVMVYCAKRRAMLIVDSPGEWDSANDIAKDSAKALTELGLNGVEARNAALYFPRITQADPLRDGQIESFVPCGMIAGVMARTDSQRGVWKAPAGIDASLNGTSGLAVNLTDAENGQLNPLGVNCLRSFPVYGRVVWGSRTMRGADQAADEWKYVPVRRTALYIEESLFRGLKWVVFEPNDEPLWAQVRLNVGAFMHNMFRQGAFQGINKKDAYFVKCDKETTTQNDINLGIVNIIVGFAPLKPAEFVIIKLQQMAGQIEV